MALTKRMILIFTLVAAVALIGCVKKNTGPDYAFTDGWVAYEYNADMDSAYNSSVHGLYSEFAVIEEKSMGAEGPDIVASLGGQPVLVDFAQGAPGMTVVKVKATEAGDMNQGVAVHESIQKYLVY